MISSFFISRLMVLAVLVHKSLANDTAKSKNVIGEYIADIGFYQSIDLTDASPIFKKSSKFQDISVEESKHYGKILVLDGVVQLTERDADAYNEMMAHMAMFAHVSPKRVLVIGGGDGYVLHEVLKHSSVMHVDHVDLDNDVIDVCREHFSWGSAWEDDRVKLHIADGSKFVREAPDNFYDVIIQDSSDPFTWADDGTVIELPSNVLYSKEHFQHINRILSSDGVFNFQAETFNIPSDLEGIFEWRKKALSVGFEDVKYGSLIISSYPTGQIGFLLCQKQTKIFPSESDIQERFLEMEENGKGTTYYQPKLQESSFDLPYWVEKAIYEKAEHDEL